MLELYRPVDSTLADDLEAELGDMVAAFRTNVVDESEKGAVPEDLPALRDGEKVISGEEALFDYLDQYRDLLSEWNRFGSDACYLEEDGSIC